MNVARVVVRSIGELFITAGLLLMLFAAYQLVWTNVEAAQAQNEVEDSLIESWDSSDPQRPGARPNVVKPEKTPDGVDKITLTRADFGKGFALLRIPRLGENYKVPVVEGVRASDLSRGVGHYPETAGPGEIGNFAIAGHRATNGEPFRNLDVMRKGDAVVVETENTWFTYVVDKTQIVAPSDTWVIDPVPGKAGVEPTERLLTLTTCHPRWASTYRLVIFTHLESKQRKSEGAPAALQARGR